MHHKKWTTKVVQDGHARRVKILVLYGWKKLGAWAGEIYWLSPYTNHRYTEQAAIDIEDLRGTFSKNYAKRWADELAA